MSEAFDGTPVGNRMIGTTAPVIVGWDNIGRVEGGPIKRFIFSWFQPVVLVSLILFWYYAPNSIAVASTAFCIGIGFRILMLALEWVSPRYASWELTWKEFATDLFYVSLGYTVLRMVDSYIGSDVLIEGALDQFNWDTFAWFTGLPLLVQAFLIVFIFDFVQYWMHRGMHEWHPLWLTHAPHHFITQFNINKGAVGNPVELFLIGLGIGGLFDFVPRAFLLAGALRLGVGIYMHTNVRFNTPLWWRYIFNTTEHHSVHHSQDFEASRSNFSGIFIFIDRWFGTCVDGEAEALGMEGGRRMSMKETMVYPITEGLKSVRNRTQESAPNVPAE